MSAITTLRATISLLLVGTLLSCSQYSIQNIGKPAPRSNEGWLKADGTPLPWRDASRALLECGAPAPEINPLVYKQALGITNPNEETNHYFTLLGCMEHSGFTLRWKDSVQTYCSWNRHKHLAACQPDAVFPVRSAEHRLNSWYCKLKTDREYCRLHAFTPSACDDPKKDYNNPPLECRP